MRYNTPTARRTHRFAEISRHSSSLEREDLCLACSRSCARSDSQRSCAACISWKKYIVVLQYRMSCTLLPSFLSTSLTISIFTCVLHQRLRMTAHAFWFHRPLKAQDLSSFTSSFLPSFFFTNSLSASQQRLFIYLLSYFPTEHLSDHPAVSSKAHQACPWSGQLKR